MLTETQIDEMVMQKYPVTEEEQRCSYVRILMGNVRGDYKTKLIKQNNEPGTAPGIQPIESAPVETV